MQAKVKPQWCFLDLLLASIIPFLLLSITWLNIPIGFDTNDDIGMMSYISGLRTGTSTQLPIYTSILYGTIITFLYQIHNSSPWYIISYMTLSWLTMSILCFYCLHLFRRDDCSRKFSTNTFSGIMLFCMLYYCVFCYYTTLFQFTTTPSICGFAAILLMTIAPKGNRSLFVLTTILLFFADTIRHQIGYLTTFAFVLAFVLMYACKIKANIKYVVIALIVLIIVRSFNAGYERLTNWGDYRKLHHERNYWMAYPHIKYDQNNEIYNVVGWDKNMYRLAKSWFFMDQKLNDFRVFSAINSMSGDSIAPTPLFPKFEQCWLFLKETVKSKRNLWCFSTFAIIFFLIFQCLFWKHDLNYLTIIVSAVIVTLCALCYFAYLGRLPCRVVFAIFVLCLLPSLLIGLRKLLYTTRLTPSFYCIALTVMICMIIYSFCGENGAFNYTYVQACNRRSWQSSTNRIVDYIETNKNNIYIYDSGCAIKMGLLNKPHQNFLCWGGALAYSPAFFAQLRANGRTNLYSDSFFDSNIYFLTTRSEPNETLVAYMRDKFGGNVDTEIIMQQPDFTVYRFNRRPYSAPRK